MDSPTEGIHEYKGVRYVLYKYTEDTNTFWEFIILPKMAEISGRAPTPERAEGLVERMIDSMERMP